MKNKKAVCEHKARWARRFAGRITMKFTIALLAGLLMTGSALAQQKEQRVALVIGNAAYKSSPLKNPVNDARAIASQLRSFGFDVTLKENLKTREIGSTYREFRTKIKPGATALVFYAGHGVQVKGQNYFPAVDAEIDAEEDVPLQSLNLGTLLENMEEAKAAVSLVFLDACRDNPFARRFRSASRGLAKVEAASGTLIHYATKPGSVAADGDGKNGTYTEALLAQLSSPLPVELMLKQVTNAVVTKTKGKQEPWVEGSLRGDFYFRSPTQTTDTVRPSPVVVAPEMSAAQREDAFWADAKAAGNKEAFEAYLETYPKGRYLSLARANIARLSKDVQVVSAPPVVAPVITPPVTKPIIASPVRLAGAAFKDCDDCPEMVAIPAGRFVMGAAPGEEESEKLPENFRNRSQPQHGVDVMSFSAGKFEVTRGQYRAFVEATGRSSAGGCWVWTGSKFEIDQAKDWRNPGYAQEDPHPVACVSWEDAKAYVVWLGQRTGKAYRLLTEAEWEYAARAGTTTRRFWGDDGDQSCAYANGADQTTKAQVPGWNYLTANCNDRYAYTAPVGSYRANAFGLYDMLGNVGEWTEDCWNENYNGAPTDARAWTAGNCSQRVLRGGSWIVNPQVLRAANRGWNSTAFRYIISGFRVARTN
jgi:formylglycine-generating enzyme required for sulfatase activity